jgi:peptidoglycan/xylan/chitin deacetylase (PgdA/CDA1 family)
MDDGAGAIGKTLEPRVPEHALRLMPKGGVQPYHRRRRLFALAAIAALALSAGLVVGATGGRAGHAHATAVNAYFGRLKTLAGNGVGSLAAGERAAENQAINRTLGYTPYVRIAGAQHRELALTFDDGPGPYTPQILSILEQDNAPATFFEVGVLENYFHASTAAIVARGYPVGDHTESHAPMGKLSPRDQRQQLLQDISATGAYGAPFPRLFRPPYGSWNRNTLKLLHKYKMLMVLWSVDTSDYRQPGVKAIVHSAVAGARPGAIILLHDAGGNREETVKALPKIIDALRARGYKFVTVPALLRDNPPPRDQQISAVIGTGG